MLFHCCVYLEFYFHKRGGGEGGRGLHHKLLWFAPACLGEEKNKNVEFIFVSLYFCVSTTAAESLPQSFEVRIALNLCLFVGKSHLNLFDLESQLWKLALLTDVFYRKTRSR